MMKVIRIENLSFGSVVRYSCTAAHHGACTIGPFTFRVSERKITFAAIGKGL
jgi:hypothetical protein